MITTITEKNVFVLTRYTSPLLEEVEIDTNDSTEEEDSASTPMSEEEKKKKQMENEGGSHTATNDAM